MSKHALTCPRTDHTIIFEVVDSKNVNLIYEENAQIIEGQYCPPIVSKKNIRAARMLWTYYKSLGWA